MEALRSVSEATLNAPYPLLIDLDGVTFCDRAGAHTLRMLQDRGAMLVGGSGFVQELLRELPSPQSPGTGERDLIRRLRAGEDQAYEQLVREYGGRLLAAARRLLNNEDEAADAVQDAFASAFTGIASFSGEAKLSTWLHRIVVNAALMKLRRRRRKPEESIEELLPRFNDDGHWVDAPTSWNAPSEVLLQQRETRQTVRRCIEQLPESYRTVLMLRDIEDLDTDEVAEMLGVTPNAVKVRLHRARQALRTLLEREVVAAPADAVA